MFKFGSKNDINMECKCTVRLLDDNEVLQCVFHRDQKGYHLLDYVCEQLNLLEKDYFGLRYVDESKQRHWLDPSRSIVKQIKGMNPIIFCFRVKFYPPDPHKLKEEITRYQIFLQLRRDLLHGRLYCSPTDAAQLAAYIIQSELGDYDPDEHVGNYVAEFQLLLKQATKVEEKIMEIHQMQLKGQVPSVCENSFLRKGCLLDTYGVDPHPVKDSKGNQLYLGINHAGILTFQGSRKTHHFKWSDVQKINYEGKMFIIHLSFNEKKHTIGFKCPSSAACKHLWRCALEQRMFFTLSSSAEAPSVVTGGSFFSRGSRFRYSGRVEKEIIESSNSIKREPPEFSRTNSRSLSFRQKSNTLTSSQSSSQDVDGGFLVLQRAKYSTPILVTKADDDDDSPMDGGRGGFINDKNYPASTSSAAANSAYHPEICLSTVDEDQEPSGSAGGGSYARISCSVDDTFRQSLGGADHLAFHQYQQHHMHHDGSSNHVSTSGGGRGQATSEQQHYDSLHADDMPTGEIQTKETGFIPLFSSQQQQQTTHSASSATSPYAALPSPARRAVAFRLLAPTLFFAAVFMCCTVVAILESDTELLSDVRRLPEIILLRREYYEPLKEYLKRAFKSMLGDSDVE